MNSDERKRFPISLPSWYEDDLILWAYIKGTTKTQLAQNLIQARIEANRNTEIEGGLKRIANDRRISVEELKAEILNKSQ